MYFVYIIKSIVNQQLYKGITVNVERRLVEHNQGKNKSTEAKMPWELVYFESYNTRIEARKREKFFKSGEGRELLKQLIKK